MQYSSQELKNQLFTGYGTLRRHELMKMAVERKLVSVKQPTPVKNVLIRILEENIPMNAEQAEEAAKPVYVPLSEAHKPQEDNIVLTLEQRRAKLEAQLKELEELEAVEAPVEEADDKDAMLAGFVGLKTNLSMLKHLRENFDVDLPKSSKRPEIVAKYKELIEY